MNCFNKKITLLILLSFLLSGCQHNNLKKVGDVNEIRYYAYVEPWIDRHGIIPFRNRVSLEEARKPKKLTSYYVQAEYNKGHLKVLHKLSAVNYQPILSMYFNKDGKVSMKFDHLKGEVSTYKYKDTSLGKWISEIHLVDKYLVYVKYVKDGKYSKAMCYQYLPDIVDKYEDVYKPKKFIKKYSCLSEPDIYPLEIKGAENMRSTDVILMK